MVMFSFATSSISPFPGSDAYAFCIIQSFHNVVHCKTYIYILQTLPEPSVWVTRLGVSCPYEFKIQSSLDSFFTSVSDFRNMSYRTMDCLPATSYNYSLCGKFGILSLYFSLCPRSLSLLYFSLFSLSFALSHENVRNMTNYKKNHIVSKNIDKTR